MLNDDNSILAELKAELAFLQQICKAEKNYPELIAKQERIENASDSNFHLGFDDCLYFQNRICEAHNSSYSIHPGSNKIYGDLKPMYWWLACSNPRMKVGMGYYGLHVRVTIVSREERCHLELSAAEFVRLHRVSLSIIFDRDSLFISRFWSKLHEALGTRLHFITTIHAHVDSQFERVIHVLEDILRCCILELEGSWEKILLLVEFAYNNSYYSSIKMAPYEALYCQKCRTPLYRTELSKKNLFDIDLIWETEEMVKVI
ncbi:reverse transcriptase [Gossypium australe]|uniref:Reverse transcriptase n=1 Tax=Gossypium australe TaxID=47621 RepID=A0A5B6UTL0_9ROSI|nr:reverse transcriptase [Gossypium australe]